MLRLKEIRKQYKLKQSEVAEILGVSQAAYSGWENERTQMDYSTLKRLAALFSVSIEYLLGDEKADPAKWVKVPVLGSVVAGYPLDNAEDILGYEDIPPSMAESGEYFALRIKGDSMAPRMLEGDTVIVRRQQLCDNGDIAVVSFEGRYNTIKKVRINSNGILLIPLNHAYDPFFYSNSDIEKYDLRIIGRVVELRSRL